MTAAFRCLRDQALHRRASRGSHPLERSERLIAGSSANDPEVPKRRRWVSATLVGKVTDLPSDAAGSSGDFRRPSERPIFDGSTSRVWVRQTRTQAAAPPPINQWLRTGRQLRAFQSIQELSEREKAELTNEIISSLPQLFSTKDQDCNHASAT